MAKRKPHIVAVVQARMGSSRLPGKVLMDIAGKPALSHVVERLQACQRIDQIVVATTTKLVDQAIIDLATALGVCYYAGSETDVLDRYYRAAREAAADVVVRITADCPLLDPTLVDRTVQTYLDARGDLDYVGVDRTFPDGLDTEVFSFAALERAWREARLKSEREHVTPYIWKHPRKFRIGTVQHTSDLSHHRWTLDHLEDLIFIREIFERAGSSRSSTLHMQDVLEILDRFPKLRQINSDIVRNEGYTKSVENDASVQS